MTVTLSPAGQERRSRLVRMIGRVVWEAASARVRVLKRGWQRRETYVGRRSFGFPGARGPHITRRRGSLDVGKALDSVALFRGWMGDWMCT